MGNSQKAIMIGAAVFVAVIVVAVVLLAIG